MSKGFDYSRFDHIGSDDEEEESRVAVSMGNPDPSAFSFDNEQGPGLVPTIPSDRPPVPMTKKGREGRYRFEYQGRLIYEWDQSLEEVNIYVEPPPNVPRNLYNIVIAHTHLSVGLKDTPPFIDEDTWGPIKSKESFWTLADGELNINLQKMNKGEAWEAALKGRGGQEVDAFTKEEVKKKIMLERFQEEHPGFDFSGADFNGTVPDAREFMGGVKRTF